MPMQKTGVTLSRTAAGIRARSEDSGGNTFNVSFSSEEPYQRRSWDGPYLEILDHADGAVDLSRLNEMGVVLFNHASGDVIGRVDSASVTDRRGVAEITFDTDDRSQVIAEKVRSGTLKGVSVRYVVDAWEEVAVGKKSSCGKYTGPCQIARKWTPLEVSIATIPADVSVGVGREFEEGETNMPNTVTNLEQESIRAVEQQPTVQQPPVEQPPIGAQRTETPPADAEQLRTQAAAEERKRVSDVMTLCREFDIDPQPHIASGASIDAVRQAVLDELIRTHQPINAHNGVVRDEADKFRAAVVDALLMRGGVRVATPAEGAQGLRHMRLRDLAIECMARCENAPGGHRMNDEELMRTFYNPSSAFPAIMDQTIERSYAAGIARVPVTFDRWTTKGSLSDFKVTQKRWVAGDAGELLLVGENGELKHDLPTDEQKPTRKLETYGRQFTMTRQALINDDIGFLTTIPARYGASARRTINRTVYSILAANPVIFDGTKLFDASRGNIMAAAAPTLAALNAALVAMMTQRSKAGDTLLVQPRYIICTPALAIYFRILIGSDTLETTATAQNTAAKIANPFKGYGLEIVEDAELAAQLANNGGTGYEWFTVADAGTVDTIQVDYLNGTETPTIRRMEQPGTLGFVWDIYHDWGIAVLDSRGLSKNPGAQPASL